MAITPKCAQCGEELQDFGAILLGPPDDTGAVQKFHLCKSCYNEVAASIDSGKQQTNTG